MKDGMALTGKHWRDTQLNYDATVGSYSKYTHLVIERGHRLVA
jgi:hypothetical protein